MAIIDFFCNKKVCILGNGSSLEKHKINYVDFDTIVGINRIYDTTFFENVDVLYHNCSLHDPLNDEKISFFNNSKKLKVLILIPGIINSLVINQIRDIKKKYSNSVKFRIYVENYILKKVKKFFQGRPLTGMTVVSHVIESGPTSVDLYGFDFYENGYVENLPKKGCYGHDVDENKNYINKLCLEHSNLRINVPKTISLL